MRRTLRVAMLLPAVALRAEAATLRPFGQLSGPTVTVADLWDDAGAAASRALGPAPGPGERIVVEAAQLAAIARQFGVDWRPASPAERSILERQGVPLDDMLLHRAVLAALRDQGAPDGELDMADFEPPLLPAEAAAHVAVDHAVWEPGTHRFVASVAVTGRDMATLRLRVSGTLAEHADVLVAARGLEAGDVLAGADLAVGRVRKDTLRGATFDVPAQAVGLALRRALAQGEQVGPADLATPMAVTRGAAVTVEIAAAGVEASAVGEAMESGAVGARVRVLNPVSRAVVLAQVTGAGMVRVSPGSLPLRRSLVPGRQP